MTSECLSSTPVYCQSKKVSLHTLLVRFGTKGCSLASPVTLFRVGICLWWGTDFGEVCPSGLAEQLESCLTLSGYAVPPVWNTASLSSSYPNISSSVSTGKPPLIVHLMN